jgi:lipoyl(octanoyl) transferase
MGVSQSERRVCRVQRLDRIEYPRALELQREMVERRRAGEITDSFLLLEHPHVVTRGSTARDEHILADARERERMGIEVFEAGRGGDVTYHGPGQLIGYPIVQLEEGRRDAHRYLRDLEEVLIHALADFGLSGGRHPRYTGVWVKDAKIAAIGVHLTRWVTSHGFALNIHPDLAYFGTIVPCGIRDEGVTSMHHLGVSASRSDVEDRVIEHFGRVFDREMQAAD